MRVKSLIAAAVAFFAAVAVQADSGTVKSVNRAGTHAVILGSDGTEYQVNLVTERRTSPNVSGITVGTPVSYTAGPGRKASSISGEACGGDVCTIGQVCCNASCGICTPPGGVCIQIACQP